MIKSDLWITRMCTPPTHIYRDEKNYFWVTPKDTAQAEQLAFRAEVASGEFREINEEELANWRPMITPFKSHLVRKQKYRTPLMEDGEREERRVISYGLSSFGYDVSLSVDQLKLFTNLHSELIDPRNMSDKCFVDATIRTDSDGCQFAILPPNSYLLGYTVETFAIPRDVLVVCLGKSTYARAGIAVNVTPIEPEFEGTVVIEIANQTNLPAKIYVDQGIAQFLFLQSDEACGVSYKDRGGKYQGQRGTVHAKV